MQQEGSAICVLPNGRRIDLFTREGSDEFIRVHGSAMTLMEDNETPEVIAAYESLDHAQGLQKKREYIQSLAQNYQLIWVVAQKCSQEIFQEHVRETTLKVFVQHFNTVLRAMATKKTWKKTGNCAEMYFPELIKCIMPLCIHDSFVKTFLAEGGDRSIAVLCEQAPQKGIDSTLAKGIISIFSNLHLCWTIMESQEYDNPDAASLKLEKSGFLFQALRCLNKCKKGKPLYDLLEELLRMNRPLPSIITAKIQKLVSTVHLVSEQGQAESRSSAMASIFCRTCGVLEHDLEQGKIICFCKNCKTAGYCSRECQVADWKSHKKLCKVIGESKERQFSDREITSHQTMLGGFFRHNHFNILRKAFAFCQERRVTKSDILIEVDFFGDAPALVGQFQFKLARPCFEKNRPEEPEWYPEGLWKGIKDQYKRMTPNHLLTICRYPDGTAGVSRISLKSQATGLSILSDEAMDAVGIVNTQALLRIFGANAMAEMENQAQRQSLLDPSSVQRVLRDLNNLGMN